MRMIKLSFAILLWLPAAPAQAARLKDLVAIEGVQPRTALSELDSVPYLIALRPLAGALAATTKQLLQFSRTA